MQKQQMVLIGAGAVVAAGIVGVSVVLFQSLSGSSKAREELNNTSTALQAMYKAKIFPSDENKAVIEGDSTRVVEWLGTVSNKLHAGDIAVNNNLSPSVLKQMMSVMALEIAKPPQVPENFAFGFEQYIGANSRMPDAEHVAKLAWQLEVVRIITTNVLSDSSTRIQKIARPVVEGGGTQQQEDSSRRGGSRGRGGRGDVVEQKQDSGVETLGGGIATRQRFTVEFTGKVPAVMDVLNRFTAMPQFIVISNLSVKRTTPVRRTFEAATGAGAPADAVKIGSEVVDFKTLSHDDRLMSDPALDEPLQVKLDLDVFVFEGV